MLPPGAVAVVRVDQQVQHDLAEVRRGDLDPGAASERVDPERAVRAQQAFEQRREVPDRGVQLEAGRRRELITGERQDLTAELARRLRGVGDVADHRARVAARLHAAVRDLGEVDHRGAEAVEVVCDRHREAPDGLCAPGFVELAGQPALLDDARLRIDQFQPVQLSRPVPARGPR